MSARGIAPSPPLHTHLSMMHIMNTTVRCLTYDVDRRQRTSHIPTCFEPVMMKVGVTATQVSVWFWLGAGSTTS